MADKRTERIAELVKELKELNCDVTQMPMKGIVKSEVTQETSPTMQGMVVETADTGRGFQIYADYKRDTSGKLKRLVR